MSYVLNYTRKPINSQLYDPRLAYSMHLAVSRDGVTYQALNHNSGVLFVKATENADGSLNPKSLKNPWLFALPGGGWGVAAIRAGGDGEDDEESKGSVVFFRSEDLVDYEEMGLLKLGTEYVEKVSCACDGNLDSFRILWQERTGAWFSASVAGTEALRLASEPETLGAGETPVFSGVRFGNSGEVTCSVGESERTETRTNPDYGTEARTFPDKCDGGAGIPDMFSGKLPPSAAIGGIEGAVPHNVVEVPEEIADRLRRKLLPPVNTGVYFPEKVEVSNPEELRDYRARAEYSDGSFAEKTVDWDLSGVDFSAKGTWEITGKVHQDHFPFPVATNRADPCIGKWNGKYYFIATNDADGNHTLYIREAASIPELVDAEEYLILDSQTYPGIGGLLWAPEFHEVNGRLYIFHAATPGEFFWEESHVMELKEGGNPICREDWSAPRRVVRKDGTDICEAGKEITLDMTCFAWQDEWYAVWSQRQFLPKDLGAWLYIAKLNPEEPWKLSTDPVVLSKPEYGWANNHTFVDEGPFALPAGDKLYLTFSSAAVDSSYVVGLLTIEKGQDLMDVRNWRKRNYPILTSRSVEGEFGTGHNAYVTDEEGNVWNTYHARPGVDAPRSSGIRRVHFNAEGEPVLDVTEELDMKEAFRNVRTTLTVR